MNPLRDIERRFDFIKEDVEIIEKILEQTCTDIELNGVSIKTLLTKIEICCDLGDKTSKKWGEPYMQEQYKI